MEYLVKGIHNGKGEINLYDNCYFTHDRNRNNTIEVRDLETCEILYSVDFRFDVNKRTDKISRNKPLEKFLKKME